MVDDYTPIQKIAAQQRAKKASLRHWLVKQNIGNWLAAYKTVSKKSPPTPPYEPSKRTYFQPTRAEDRFIVQPTSLICKKTVRRKNGSPKNGSPKNGSPKNGSPKTGSPNTLQKASKRKNTVAYNFAAYYSYL